MACISSSGGYAGPCARRGGSEATQVGMRERWERREEEEEGDVPISVCTINSCEYSSYRLYGQYGGLDIYMGIQTYLSMHHLSVLYVHGDERQKTEVIQHFT
jgi:hypothetical protein